MPEIDYAFGKVRQGEDADRPAYRCLLALSPKLYVFSNVSTVSSRDLWFPMSVLGPGVLALHH